MNRIVTWPIVPRTLPLLMVIGERGITQLVDSDNQDIQPVQRIRLAFSKEGATRYISHLDLARALERALNRANLPVAYTQGFNRRPRLSLAAALPLGYTSHAEIADVWLVRPITPDDLMARLMPKMPGGITLRSAVEVPVAAPSLQQQISESVYIVRFFDKVDITALRVMMESVMAAESLIQQRTRPKSNQPQTIDLRPLILDMALEIEEGEEPVLHLRLVQTATQTGRPDDVLKALGMDPLVARVHRVALRLAEPC